MWKSVSLRPWISVTVQVEGGSYRWQRCDEELETVSCFALVSVVPLLFLFPSRTLLSSHIGSLHRSASVKPSHPVPHNRKVPLISAKSKEDGSKNKTSHGMQ